MRRVPGTAVFLNRGNLTTPLAMRANVEHNHVLHEHVVVLSIDTKPAPYVADADRVQLDDLGYLDDGISFVTACVGYMEDPNVADMLRLAAAAGVEGPIDVDDASYFLSTIDLQVGNAPGCRIGANGCSSGRRTSPPTPRSTSACRATAPW